MGQPASMGVTLRMEKIMPLVYDGFEEGLLTVMRGPKIWLALAAKMVVVVEPDAQAPP